MALSRRAWVVGRQAGQAVLVGLQVAEGDLAERGGDHGPEGRQIGLVGALGGRAAPVQPERHQPGVVFFRGRQNLEGDGSGTGVKARVGAGGQGRGMIGHAASLIRRWGR